MLVLLKLLQAVKTIGVACEVKEILLLANAADPHDFKFLLKCDRNETVRTGIKKNLLNW